jgi:protein polybromo-1
VRALSLEILKRRVDRGLYKRLDLLQRDVFWVLTRARRLSRTDSQAGGGFSCPMPMRAS